ncbi:MAG: hypothetical protein RJA36_3307 [Pseudomonadota bacterium]|jgi:vitamin B12 transporter
MKFHSSARLAALPLALCAVFPAFAQTQLKQTVVTATRFEQPLTDVVADVTLIDREQIERSGVAALADLLAQVPGTEFARNGGPAGTTSVYLRGAETRFTAVYIDGVRIDSQSTGGASWQAIPLSQVDRIEVLRGPAAAIYGSDALAGVVQIFTRKGEGAFSPYLGLGLGSHRTGKLDAGFSGAGAGFDYSLGLTREVSQGFNALSGSNPDLDGYRNYSSSARLGWQIAPAQRLEATLLDSRQDARYDSMAAWDPAALARDDRNLQHLQTVGLSWEAKWNEVYSSRVSASQGHDRYETSPSVYLTDTKVRSYLWHNVLRQGAHQWTAALERREDELENDYTTPALTQRAQNAVALGYGFKEGAHVLQLNARHDDDSEFGGKSTGSAAYGYGFAPNWRATASAGTAFRAPTLFQRFSIYGTPTLRPESSHNVEAGVKYAGQGSSFSAVAYRNRVDNLISYVSGPGSCINGSGAWAGCYGNTAQAQYEGLTLAGAQQVGAFRLRASLDLQNPRDLDTGKQLARRSREHGLLGADTRLAGWQLGGELLLSGRRYDDAANTKPLGGYGLVNLHASTSIARDWTLLARVDNLADKRYELARTYFTPGRTFYAGLKWAPQ